MAKLIITRRRQLQNALIPMAISVDGAEQKGLRSGGRLELDLPTGKHRLVAGNDELVEFDDYDGEHTHIEVWVSTFTSRGRARVKS